MPRKIPLLIAAVALAGLVCWRFPLFHIVPLQQAQREQQAEAFDPVRVAREFWNVKLLPAAERSVKLKDLLAALAKDPAGARTLHGRTLGLGGSTMFLVRGAGKVTAILDEAIIMSLDGTDATVSLSTGLLFGNTVRDASGLLDVSAYPNSQDFNNLSTQLNGIVEAEIMPALQKQAAVGRTIRFAGCTELEEAGWPKTLVLIPIKIEWP